MNRETLEYLTAAERTGILDDLDDMLADDEITIPVTYRRFVSRTFDPVAGTHVATYSETATRAIRSELMAREVLAGNGLYQVGDMVFYVVRSAIATAPGREDRLVADSITYEFITSVTDPINALWRLIVRRVSGTGG